MSRYVVISRIQVQNANMHSNGFLLGGAPLMAASMFAHHIARQLGTQDQGIIYIHHDMQRLGGQAYGRFTPAQRRGAVFIGKNDYSSKNKYALSLQPTASCHLQFSLIIKFASGRMSSEKIADILRRSRFAGGQIINFAEISTHGEKNLQQALQEIKTGFVLLDRQDLLLKYQQQQQCNKLEAFSHLLGLKNKPLRAVFNDESLSWIAATNLGYALLEAATTERAGIRQAQQQDSTAHAYAEPLTGLIQYYSLNNILPKAKQDENAELEENTEQAQNTDWQDLEQLLWTYSWPQQDIFLLQQQYRNTDAS